MLVLVLPRVSSRVSGFPVASPCLWGKLQNLSFCHVANCENCRKSRTKCSFWCSHASRLESLVFLWLRRVYGGSRKTSPFQRFPSRLSCRFAWQAWHFVTFQPVCLRVETVKIGGSLARNARFSAPTCLVSSLWFFLWRRRVYGGSCKTSPFRRFPSRLPCRFAWQAWHFVTLQPVCLRVETVKIAGSLVRNVCFSASTCLVSSLWFSCGVAVSIGEAPHSTLYTLHSTLHNLHLRLHTPHSTLHTLHFALYTPHSSPHTLHSSLHTPHFTLLTPHSTPYTPHSSLYTPHFTLYTFQSTLHNPHFTLHTSHFTLLTPHSTPYTLHSTLYTLHSTLYTLHSTLHTLHFTFYTPHFTFYTPHSTLYTFHSTLHTPHSTLHTPHFTVLTPRSTLYTLHSTLQTLHFTLYTLHSTLYTLHSTLYTPHFTFDTPHSTLHNFTL